MPGSSQIDDALKRVRDAFDEAANEAEQMSEAAQTEVQEAIDDLEARIEELRKRE